MRVYLVCITCMLHIAGCKTVGVKGTSLCTLCKNTECLRKRTPKVFVNQLHVLDYSKSYGIGKMIPPNHYIKNLCPECRRKEDEENAKKTCWG